MRQFQVPQFIEVEDKIFGPLTLKQFLYVLGAGASLFLLYVLLPLFLTILLGAPIVVFFAALAFYKVNGRPFIKTVENAVNYFSGARLYIWRKEERPRAAKENKEKKTAPSSLRLPKLTESKLKDLAWSLDVQEKTKQDAPL